jgi:hypothetical protein
MPADQTDGLLSVIMHYSKIMAYMTKDQETFCIKRSGGNFFFYKTVAITIYLTVIFLVKIIHFIEGLITFEEKTIFHFCEIINDFQFGYFFPSHD